MELLQRLDDEVVHGEPNGATPVGVAAHDTHGGLGRLITDLVTLPFAIEDEGMREVVPRKRPNAEVGQELLRVQHPLQQAFHAESAKQRQQTPLADARHLETGDEPGEILPFRQEVLSSRGEAWQLLQDSRLQHLHGKEGDQSHHRPYLQRNTVTTWKREDVIVEIVLFVPEALPRAREAGHGPRDVQEVLEKLCRHILVDRIGLRKLQRHAHQGEAEERHPARAIGLVDDAAGRQLAAPVEDTDVVEA
mmetsp:Transcript_39497/g.113609  ORF Transcript_39497/g.113609 Transcript_39497/m.113609 type:complete len:249 (-) Transcript_39497:1890-2636(-)